MRAGPLKVILGERAKGLGVQGTLRALSTQWNAALASTDEPRCSRRTTRRSTSTMLPTISRRTGAKRSSAVVRAASEDCMLGVSEAGQGEASV